MADLGLRIWGTGWSRVPRSSSLRACVTHEAVYCEAFGSVVGATAVNLAFLRKRNRDRHTSRTFEIPACGGFQLSERTDEVLRFFDEGTEIECFDSDEELRHKTAFYLAHPDSRVRIARAGHARAMNSGYSFIDRLKQILARVEQRMGPGAPSVSRSGAAVPQPTS